MGRVTVVVTGIGLVSPWGHDRAQLEAALRRGPPEASALSTPDALAAPLPCVPLAPGGDPEWAVKRRRDVRLMARANVLAVAAARRALADAGLDEADARLEDAGLFMGAGREPGNLDDVRDALAAARDPDAPGRISLTALGQAGMHRMNPLASIKTLPNMTFAHVGITLGLRGPGMTLTDDAAGGLCALREAALCVLEGRASLCLAGAADALTDFAGRVTIAREGGLGPLSEAAIVLVLERADAAAARGARVLATLEVEALDAEVDRGAPRATLHGIHCGAADAVLRLVADCIDQRHGAAGGLTLRAFVAQSNAPAVHVRRPAPPRVAITAVGLRTPLGYSLEELGPRLLSGECAVAPICAFDASVFPTRLACEVQASTETLLASLPEPLRAAFEGLDDRKSALGLAAAMDAFAGVDRTGRHPAHISYGTGLSSVTLGELEEDFMPFLSASGAFDYEAFERAGLRPESRAPRRHAVTRAPRGLQRALRLVGPVDTHFSACAAAAAAVGHALDRVARGEVSVALAGGADSMVHPFGLLPFILLGATSTATDPRRAAQPFDRDRGGFVMGEGAAFFVLEPLERVRAEGREPLAVLLGHGTSGDAHNVTAPHPEGRGAQRAMTRALQDAGLDPTQVDYVNAHGTGTPLNDVIEAAAIRAVFGARCPAVSSSKGQLGHTIAAAGAVELAACVASVRAGRLPPSVGLENPDPRVELDLVGADGRACAQPIILSNSFGFGGQNAVLALAHPDRVDENGVVT